MGICVTYEWTNISKVHFLHEHCVVLSNPSSNLESKYWRFQNMWNQSLDLGTIFWDIWLLKTGIFRYMLSHKVVVAVCNNILMFILPTVLLVNNEHTQQLVSFNMLSHKLLKVADTVCNNILLFTLQTVLLVTELACFKSWFKLQFKSNYFFNHWF